MPHPFIEVLLKKCESCEMFIKRALSKRDGFESPQHYYRRRFCSKKCFGKTQTGTNLIEWMAIHGGPTCGKAPWNKGIKRSDISGEKHPNWKGGITPINKTVRNSMEYKVWRKSVFERDDYTCQECGLRGIYLEADHIKPFAYFPELRCEVSNGRTLCKECHKKTPTYKGRVHRYQLVN